ncbi:oxygen-insensitive NAD(P)H nitroreductase [Vibrio sp.]|uniref:oxygen-insensitive NAD(P)H nitroreductase n=1 Tax=Vibrio sp. TaxID=678 RepID=UPI003D138DBC
MSLLHAAQSRYATKAFDPERRISEEKIEKLKQVVRLSPSSVNSQPWHFIVAGTEQGKQRIASATAGDYAFNQAKVLNASHVVVLCAKTEIDDNYLQALLENEQQDGRFPSDEIKATVSAGRQYFVNKHRHDLNDARHWMEKQVYLNLGTLLLGASSLEIDAVPIEGFDAELLDREFDLAAQGYTSVVLVALGYHSEQDFNAKLPKSRWPEARLFTEC